MDGSLREGLGDVEAAGHQVPVRVVLGPGSRLALGRPSRWGELSLAGEPAGRGLRSSAGSGRSPQPAGPAPGPQSLVAHWQAAVIAPPRGRRRRPGAAAAGSARAAPSRADGRTPPDGSPPAAQRIRWDAG